MIDFSNIDKWSWKYDLFNRYLRFNHNKVYYKEYRVDNQDKVPPPGEPLFIIGNHQNGLTDALVLLYMYPDKRQPVFIARGDIFKKDFVAKLLHFLKILPSFRDRDGSRGDVRANSNIFNIAAEVLGRGNTLVMFPEASHQHGNYLGGFKKGFPRIALDAEAKHDFKLGVKILPVNIYYEDYYNFHSRVLATVGEAFTIESLKELYDTEPNSAYLKLNEMAREKLKEITLDEDPEFYPQYDTLRKILRRNRIRKRGGNPKDLCEMKTEDIQIVAELDQLKKTDNERFTKLMNDAAAYEKGVRKLKIRDWLVESKIPLVTLVLKSLLLLVTFPFYLFGLINNGLPFHAPNLLKKKIKDKQLHSSMNFAPAVLFTFPIMYLIIFIIAWIVSGKWWISLVYCVVAFWSLLIYNAYRKAFVKWRGSCRYRSLERKKNSLLLNIKEIKGRIMRKDLI
ncbi:MAG: 1-acyl-sn-glycerol-3-phosphate acyltransferase [Bacteroidales bacterium]|jgi:1-acyl-sn-glycerol-3-phosphate acyltransferase|nr:1-acyl-sn-glycerol-3-phosphate acyltransferase [Bacteroidales bacterium]